LQENPATMADFRWLAIAALGLGCAAPSAPPCDPWSRQLGQVARVEVSLAPDAGSLDPEASARLVATVRQSALDWFEQRGRFATEGQLALRVTIDSVRLRGTVSTWLFGWVAAPDHLAARVSVEREHTRDLVNGNLCPARVESALAGWSWRDREARLDRLARRLGQRVAEGL
jgi:hypothetical protein